MLLSVILLMVAIGGYYIYKAAVPAKSAWYSSANGTWNYRQKITIDHTKVNTATGTTTPLTNFPVLVSITNSNLAYTGFGGNVASSSGADILFADATGANQIPYEREYYASSTGQLIAWVKITSLPSTVDTTIYMYYGNSTAGLADQQQATSVWDSNYKGVWHLKETLTGANQIVYDSTNNATNASSTGTWLGSQQQAGKIDGSLNFSGSDNLYGPGTALTDLGPITVSTWINLSASGSSNILYKSDNNGSKGWFLRIDNSLGLVWDIVGGGGNAHSYSTVNVPTVGKWAYVTGTWAGGSNPDQLYVNGAEVTYSTHNSGPISHDSDAGIPFCIGTGGSTCLSGTGGYVVGLLDEVRVSSSARSVDWIKTEYLNQNSPATFYAVGGLQKQNSGKGEAVTSRGAGLSWYNTGGTWTNRRQIIINHNYISQTATTTYSSFPFLFSSTDNELKYTDFSGGKVASSTGGDILFTAADGTTKLDYELESYSSSTGATVAWVRIPLLSAAADTVIYLYYGNGSSPYQQNPSGVWDANYKAVWHLPNQTSLGLNDSTSNNHTLANNNGVAVTTGKVDGGASLSSGSSQSLSLAANQTDLQIVNNFTLEIWVKTAAAVQQPTLLNNQDQNAARKGVGIGFSSGKAQISYNSGSVDDYTYIGTATIVDSTWHKVVFAVSPSNLGTFFVDGVADTPHQYAFSVGYSTTQPFYIGRNFAGNYDTFSADEIRVSNIARSADWAKTEYNNQANPQTFYVLSGASNAQSRPANVPLIKSRGGVKFH